MAIDNGDSENAKVYDPTMGEERDAFPGEIVPPEQQSTLQRLMAAEDRKYQGLVDAVSGSGQFTPDELNIILRAGKVASEVKRIEYLEAANSNPANIIQQVFKAQDLEDPAITGALEDLNRKVRNITERVRTVKTSAEIAKEPIPDTASCIGKIDKGDTSRSTLLRYGFIQERGLDSNDFFILLQKLGAVPTSQIQKLADFERYIPYRPNRVSNDTDLYYSLDNGRSVFFNIDSTLPGLEGIYFELALSSDNEPRPRYLVIQGDQNAFTRIVDYGLFTPFSSE